MLGAACSGNDSSSEQGEVAGLSPFMATALKVVSAPEAFLQKEQGPRHTTLPCFSFNNRGALVKTMSRKHSTVSQQSATDGVLPSARGLRLSGSLASQRTPSGLTASSHGQTLSRQQSSQQDVSTQQASEHQGAMQTRSQHMVGLLAEAGLGSIPEEEPAAVQKVKKVVKKRRRKMKRGSRLTQPGGMTDQEKSIWLLEHCKVLMCACRCVSLRLHDQQVLFEQNVSRSQSCALLIAQINQIILQLRTKSVWKRSACNVYSPAGVTCSKAAEAFRLTLSSPSCWQKQWDCCLHLHKTDQNLYLNRSVR